MDNDLLTITCKHCQEGYAIRNQNFHRKLLLTYCTEECAIADGMSEEEAHAQFELTVWQCAGCKQYFPHKDLTYRKGDFGYTPLCQPCADDPKYYCFFPFADRLSAGLVSSEEIANFNALHDM